MRDNESPFFIVGCSRSGTTLLRMILAGHPRISIPPETWYIIPLVHKLPLLGRLTGDEVQTATGIITSHPRWPDQGLSVDAFKRLVDRISSPRLVDLLNVVYSYHLDREGKVRAGDKTPHYIAVVPQIAELYPSSTFIHVVRDGRDVSQSFIEAGFHGRAYHGARFEWVRAVNFAKRLKASELADRFFEVRFEELVAEPNKITKEVCSFLGEEFFPSMLNWHNRLHLIPERERVIQTRLFFPLSRDVVNSRRDRKPLLKSLFVEAPLQRELVVAGYDLWFSSPLWKPILAAVRLLQRWLSPLLDRALPFLARRGIVSPESVMAALVRQISPKLGQQRLAKSMMGKVQGETVLVRTRYGFKMYLHTAEFIQRNIYLTGTWEDEIATIVGRLRTGELFVDVGAHVGFFSLLAASRGASVIAFEPNPVRAIALRKNIKLNSFNTIELRTSEIGSGERFTDFISPESMSLGLSGESSCETEITDRANALDAQLENRVVSLLRIDAEGAESKVLSGAKQILAQDQAPDVICQISNQCPRSLETIVGFMGEFGFSLRSTISTHESNRGTLRRSLLFSKRAKQIESANRRQANRSGHL